MPSSLVYKPMTVLRLHVRVELKFTHADTIDPKWNVNSSQTTQTNQTKLAHLLIVANLRKVSYYQYCLEYGLGFTTLYGGLRQGEVYFRMHLDSFLLLSSTRLLVYAWEK